MASIVAAVANRTAAAAIDREPRAVVLGTPTAQGAKRVLRVRFSSLRVLTAPLHAHGPHRPLRCELLRYEHGSHRAEERLRCASAAKAGHRKVDHPKDREKVASLRRLAGSGRDRDRDRRAADQSRGGFRELAVGFRAPVVRYRATADAIHAGFGGHASTGNRRAAVADHRRDAPDGSAVHESPAMVAKRRGE
jgi:hypothetical protein